MVSGWRESLLVSYSRSQFLSNESPISHPSQPQKTLDAVLEYVGHGGAMTETGGSSAVAAPVSVDDPHASEDAAKLAEPEHHAGHTGK